MACCGLPNVLEREAPETFEVLNPLRTGNTLYGCPRPVEPFGGQVEVVDVQPGGTDPLLHLLSQPCLRTGSLSRSNGAREKVGEAATTHVFLPVAKIIPTLRGHREVLDRVLNRLLKIAGLRA